MGNVPANSHEILIPDDIFVCNVTSDIIYDYDDHDI